MCATPELASCAWAGARHVATEELDAAAGWRAQTAQGLDQLALTIALHARNAHDLTGAHSSDTPSTAASPRSEATCRLLDPQHDLARFGGGLVDAQQHGPTHHHRRQ